MHKIMGIDEAGRGPVIGSLFIGFSIVYLENFNEFDNFDKFLKKLGVKDSKKLSVNKRKEVFKRLKENLDFRYVQLTPTMLDNAIFSGNTINELQFNSILHILNLERPDIIFIDSPIKNTEKYKEKLLKGLNYLPDMIVCENKADERYRIVGAASILAKEMREKEIKEIKKKLNVDFGSGYPSDPITIDFLKKNYDKKEFEMIFRKSWQTYKNLLSKKNLKDFF